MLGENITIIGGSGDMGQVFGRYFKQHGFKITLLARDENKLKAIAKKLEVKYELDLKKSVDNADIVIVSIPIHTTPEMIKKIAPLMKNNSLLLDLTSLKQDTCRILSEIHKIYPINCLSIHPMFGPGIKTMKNYVIIALKIGGTEHYGIIINELLDLFRSDGLIITETTPDIHDSMIALTLGVPHMFNILFLNLLKRADEPLNRLTRYTGTTFLLQKIFAESIIQGEMDMLGEIQMGNSEFHKILDLFEDLLKQYKKIIQKRDKTGFNEIFIQGLEYSKEDSHFKNSYKNFYEFMKILKKEK